MVVQHNLTAINSNRMLGLTTASQSKSTERLSSGYKINRAADDAAGLAISEKMRKQVRGLTQAVGNAQDGISAVQTAEGALAEVHDMLQRMNELATKSANGTNSSSDRSYIQSEVDALAKEIDRVSETTKFNEIYLLKGDASGAQIKTASLTKKDATDAVPATDAAASQSTGTGITDVEVTDQEKLNSKATEDSNILKFESGEWRLNGTKVGTNGDAADVLSELGITLTGTATNSTNDEITITKYVAETPAQPASTAKLYSDSTGATAVTDLSSYFDEGGSLVDGKKLYYEDPDNAGTFLELADPAGTSNDYVTFEGKTKALSFNLQVGADGDDNNKIGVTIDSMSAVSLGVGKKDGDETKGVDVSSEDAASAAIKTIESALEAVSKQRSDLGAVQNRLEHTVNNLNNVVENTTSAESQIRDTDMATEMVKYANNNILAQAGQAMLAQANQSNQGVLSLLG